MLLRPLEHFGRSVGVVVRVVDIHDFVEVFEFEGQVGVDAPDLGQLEANGLLEPVVNGARPRTPPILRSRGRTLRRGCGS